MGGVQEKLLLLAGASGLVGGCALDALLEAPEVKRVFAVSRRPLGRGPHPRLANRIVQFERLEAQLQGTRCDAALCCLGTTLRQAGSPQAFRAVDVDCVLAFARAARAAGARRFVVISSVGADPGARSLYLRTKGEVEEQLEGAGFESLDVLQPSLLLGWRAEMRPLELAARAFMPLVNPLLRGKYIAYRAVSARTVGTAMLGATRSGRRGVQRYTYAGIAALALIALLAVGCSSLPAAAPDAHSPSGARIAELAASLVGTRYQFGGADAVGFDCSGLARYVHERAGFAIPRTAAEQQRAADPVPLAKLAPGDLVFFRIRRRGIDHVGVYTGGGRFVHAPRAGRTIAYGDLSRGFYARHLVGAGRFWDGARRERHSSEKT